jgi:cation diffusion facilitator CzcD-associated flavoprotein CzcO
MSTALDRLADSVRHDLELLDYPRRSWLLPRRTRAGEHIFDVLIVGAGQGGLATAFGLLRERVTNVVVVDQNPLDRAGPWRTFARMQTLRTPKHVTGPDLGLPSLSPRAYYEAVHGPGSWGEVKLIPKETWAAYLAWYRQTLGIPVEAETRVGRLRFNVSERAWEVPCTSRRGEELRYARRVVLATGIEGSGAWQVPKFVRDALPERLYAHTRAEIDFDALAGRRVAVLGAGASAFDNAAMALEAGASEVRVFFRRASLVRVNAYRWAEFTGFLKHHADLPDALKWRFVAEILRLGQLPPADTLERARRHPNFQLHPGSSLRALAAHGDRIRFETDERAFETDFLIVATGFVTNLKLRPELSELEPFIARWADRFQPPAAERNDELAEHPYLGAHFEFTEREPGSAPYLGYLFNYTFGGLLSLGFGGASISGMKYSNPRLVAGITRSLYLEDAEEHLQSLVDFSEVEF